MSPQPVIDTTKPILVTGATGYIASWIIKLLLERGLHVRGTVRNPDKASSVEHLHALAADTVDSQGSLELVGADLLEAGSFDAAAQGCELVIHTASPFILSGFKDANEALVKPAVDGTHNVLSACNQSGSVKRVVLTSSVASIYGDNIDMRKVDGCFTEMDWNTTSSVDHQPYSFSKVSAEREAWKMVGTQPEEQLQWDLVTINPSLVLGPSLAKNSDSGSIDTFKKLCDGTMKTGAPDLTLGVVDVRDVAKAHIEAGLRPQASGRHILSAEEVSLLELAKILRGSNGHRYPFPKRQLPKFLVKLAAPAVGMSRQFVELNVGHPLKFDNSRSRDELGIDYRSVGSTVNDHFEQMLNDEVIRRKV